MRKYISLISIMILVTMCAFSFQALEVVFADDDNQPDLLLNIQGDKSNGGPIFKESGDLSGNDLWVPGRSKAGTIRINNNYSKRIKVKSFGLKMKLERLNGQSYKQVNNEDLYELYAQNMKLTVKKGTFLFFEDTIYEKSFFEMLYDSDNEEHNGYNLPSKDQFNINSNKSIDLKYEVKMDEKAGNNMQGLRATVDFLINVQENSQSNDDNNDDDDDKNNRSKKVSKTSEEHWAHSCIKALLDNGIIQGYPNGKMSIEDYKNGSVKLEAYIEEAVKPEENITRAETAELIDNALNKLVDNYGEIKQNDLSKFYDDYNKIAKWSKLHVIRLTEKGVMKGYPGLFRNKYYFKPNKEISREEMTAVLIRAFEKKLNKEIELGFVDKSQISDWAQEYVKAAVENKVIEGYPDNKFKPQDSITRAEVFTIICKLLGYHDTHLK